jgi:hypothetical protein
MIVGKLNRLIHNFDFVTTLYDFYGFKRLSDNETKKTLEEKIKNGVKQGFSMRLEGAVSLELLIVSKSEKSLITSLIQS